jgi:hypothetical protein
VETEHVWVVFKTHFGIGFTEPVAQVLARYRGPMVDNAMAVKSGCSDTTISSRA